MLRASGVSTGGRLSVSHCPALNERFEVVSYEWSDVVGMSVSPRWNELVPKAFSEWVAVWSVDSDCERLADEF